MTDRSHFIHPSPFAVHAAVASLILALTSAVAIAQDYPTKPVRFLVPNPPGGGTDLVARIVTRKVGEKLGVNVVVDNRPGAGGIIAAEVAMRAAPDGYTLLMAHFPLAITVSMVKVRFDPVRDFAPVILMATTQNVLSVNPSLPAKSVKELIALAKSKPGELRYATGGNGTSMHVSAELFSQMAGVRLTHVPYKGAAPALVDLISGQVQLSFLSVPAASGQIRAGRIHGLAVTGARRSPVLPDLPTLSEAGLPGYGAEQWYGVVVPAGTPRAVVRRLHADFEWALNQPDIRSRLAGRGFEIAADMTEAGFGRFLKGEIAKWAGVVKKAGLKAH